MKKAALIALPLAAAIACMCILTGCGALKSAQALQAYELGTDSIPTVNSVVGERSVTGVKSGTGTGGTYKEYVYQSETATEDLIAYLIHDLLENGWYALVDFDLTQLPGTAQIATQSVDSGQIIIMDVAYEQGGYTIRLTKGEGSLTLN